MAVTPIHSENRLRLDDGAPPSQASSGRFAVSPAWLRRILVANLVGQVLIVLSGGVVRLTGSGLGCPTFPECVHGSYVPVVHQPQGFHKYIEFGNRMLTFVLTVLAVAALVAVWRFARGGGRGADGLSGRRLVLLGAVPFLGVLAQALIGGISVLTKLNPTVVAVHFLASMALIVGSTILLLVAVPDRIEGGELTVSRERPGPRVRALAVALGLVTVPVLILGTMLTGSGPHSGDANDPNRFGFDIPLIAHLHAGAVWVFVLLLATLIVALRRTAGPRTAQRRALVLLAVTLCQGVIGYVQYALGVPPGLVAVHLLGAALLTTTTTATVYAVVRNERGAHRATLVEAGHAPV